jgi:hypothetical protein
MCGRPRDAAGQSLNVAGVRARKKGSSVAIGVERQPSTDEPRCPKKCTASAEIHVIGRRDRLLRRVDATRRDPVTAE